MNTVPPDTAASAAAGSPPALAPQPGLSRYGGLAALLRARITQGDWVPGGAIPAESVLAREHGVALGTMRQAIAVLVAEGLLERVQGRGTFVRAGLSGASMLRFFRFRSQGQALSEAPRSEILHSTVAPASDAQAEALGLPAGAELMRLRRLRSIAGTPCLLETLWLPLPLFQPLRELPTAEWGDLLYPRYLQTVGVPVTRAQDDLSFGLLSAADARDLQLPSGHPCVQVSRRAFDIKGRCIELRQTLGDAFSFHYSAQLR